MIAGAAAFSAARSAARAGELGHETGGDGVRLPFAADDHACVKALARCGEQRERVVAVVGVACPAERRFAVLIVEAALELGGELAAGATALTRDEDPELLVSGAKRSPGHLSHEGPELLR
jgi:hypothetical protein